MDMPYSQPGIEAKQADVNVNMSSVQLIHGMHDAMLFSEEQAQLAKLANEWDYFSEVGGKVLGLRMIEEHLIDFIQYERAHTTGHILPKIDSAQDFFNGTDLSFACGLFGRDPEVIRKRVNGLIQNHDLSGLVQLRSDLGKLQSLFREQDSSRATTNRASTHHDEDASQVSRELMH